MSEQKLTVPVEVIDLPSKGLIYPVENPLSSGKIDMKYMTAREEDILTNINLLRQGIAIEKMLISLIKSPINHDDLILGDRNALLIAARILAYGKDYSFKYKHPETDVEEVVEVDLQDLKYKEINLDLYANKNEFPFTLPHSKVDVTFRVLTVGDDKKIDVEIKSLKKSLGQDAGAISTRLKHQILSVNGDYTTKTIREFVDQGHLLSRDSIELRKQIERVSPDIKTNITFSFKDGVEVSTNLPMTTDFFFPGSNL